MKDMTMMEHTTLPTKIVADRQAWKTFFTKANLLDFPSLMAFAHGGFNSDPLNQILRAIVQLFVYIGSSTTGFN